MYISNIKSQRFQLRLTPETYWRIKMLASYRRTSMAQIIEYLVDQAWCDNYAIFGFGENN